MKSMIENYWMKAELKCLISGIVNWHSAVAKTALSDSELFQRVADKWDSLYYEITESEMAKFIDTYDLAVFEMINDGELNSLNIDTCEEIVYLNHNLLWK